jgi:hypothetical protein
MSGTSTIQGPLVALTSVEWPGALDVTKNATTPVPVWNPSDNPRTPVVYTREALQQSPTVRVGLEVLDPILRRDVELRILRVDSTGVVGGSQRSVEVRGEGAEVAELAIDVTPAEGGPGVVKEALSWCWQYRVDGPRGWTDFARTEHDLYVVLDAPAQPWGQPGDGPHELPWLDALDIACEWAATARTTEEAAGAIARRLHHFSVGSRYVRYGDNRSFFRPDDLAIDWCGIIFTLAKFLDVLNGRSTEPLDWRWNCAVCATAAQTLAAVLGCPVKIKKLEHKFGGTFDLNPVWLLGEAGERPDDFFLRHEVALEEPSNGVFDACLRLDEDTNPANPPADWAIPVNWEYDTYRNTLILQADEVPMLDIGPYNRYVERVPPGAVLTTHESVERLREAFLTKLKSDSAQNSFGFLRDHAELVTGIDGFAPPVERLGQAEWFPGAWHPVSAWRWQSLREPEVVLGLTIFSPPDRDRAMHIIAALSSRLTHWRFDENRLPRGRKRGDGGEWDYAFVNRDSTVVLFLLGNLAMELASDGERDVDVTPYAGRLSISIARLLA